jgi:hypothetical protein
MYVPLAKYGLENTGLGRLETHSDLIGIDPLFVEFRKCIECEETPLPSLGIILKIVAFLKFCFDKGSMEAIRVLVFIGHHTIIVENLRFLPNKI